jgi:hypothetical protein
MGIEYIADALLISKNQRVATAESTACDFRVKSIAIPANSSQRGDYHSDIAGPEWADRVLATNASL